MFGNNFKDWYNSTNNLNLFRISKLLKQNRSISTKVRVLLIQDLLFII